MNQLLPDTTYQKQMKLCGMTNPIKFVSFALAFFLLMNNVSAQTLAELEKKRIGLPNGWSLTPVGKNIPVGDLPLNLVVSNNKYAGIIHLHDLIKEGLI